MFWNFLFCIIFVNSFNDEFHILMTKTPHNPEGIIQGPHGFSFKQPNYLPIDKKLQFDLTTVYFSGIFTNGTVLQRAPNKAAIYGSAPPNTNVHVSITNGADYQKQLETYSNMIGDWKIVLPETREAGGNYTFVASCDGCPTKHEMFNVTFGDVWYCAGQSNMELAIKYTFSRNESWAALQNGEYSNIRFIHLDHYNVLDEDRAWVLPPNKGGEWKETPSKDDFDNFSAVCWYFAQELTNRMGDDAPPFGLIHAAIGGTMVEAWTSNHTLDDCVVTDSVCSNDKKILPCGGLFNGMVAPFLNKTIKGVLWYQGENNMHEDKGNVLNNTGYACMFNKMKDEWRSLWSVVPGTTDPEFGWGVVTLQSGTDEGGPDIEGMRWAQTQNYGVIPNPLFKNGFMAQGYDLGDPYNGGGCWARGNNRCSGWAQTVAYSSTRTNYYMGSIHPRVKFEVGRRLAVTALNVVYGHKEKAITGPTISSCNYTKQNDHKFAAHYQFELNFNTTLMNPMGPNANGSLNMIYVYKSPYQNLPGGTLQLLLNDTWVGFPFDDKHQNKLAEGVVIFNYISQDDPTPPSGIRYAWNGSCCPGLDTAILPCVPRSCPIMMKWNTTYDANNIQVGLEEGLPANPFWADLVVENANTGHCVCKAPQICH